MLKICNIENLYEARSAAEMGVSYLGLHLISSSDRKRLRTTRRIITMLHREYPLTKAVLVTKESEPQQLIELINDLECDAIQLHYLPTKEILIKLRSVFGKRLEIILVATEETIPSNEIQEYADLMILDKNYTGGSGKEISADALKRGTSRIMASLLLAGGIDSGYLRTKKITNNKVLGFDIQSGVKASRRTEFENTDFEKLREVSKLAHCAPYESKYLQVGFSLNDHTSIEDYYGSCDFWHFDFFNDVFGESTDTRQQVASIHKLVALNSHYKIQIHVYTRTRQYIDSLSRLLRSIPAHRLEWFIHYSQELQPAILPVSGQQIYPSLDVRDILTDQYNYDLLPQPSKLIICLQSQKHLDRTINTTIAIKLLRADWARKSIIYLDRNVRSSDLLEVRARVDGVISGMYLKDFGEQAYEEFKEIGLL